MSERDTPETDAAMRSGLVLRDYQEWIVDADFARRLERQRDELAEALRPFVDHGTCFEDADIDRARAILARIDAEKSSNERGAGGERDHKRDA